MPPTPQANGDLPMTEQMTGRQEAGASGRPPAGPPAAQPNAGSPGTPGPSGPSGPSPRDLAARSHREAVHPADQLHQTPATPAPAAPAPAAAASTATGPAATTPAVPAPTPAPEPSRTGVASLGKVRATGAQALVYALE